MTRVRLLLIAFAVVLPQACATSDQGRDGAAEPVAATHRVLTGGAVVGTVTSGGAEAWLGLPYATPPVGELRWRAPRAPAAWSGVRSAVSRGAACPQYPSPLGGVEGPKGQVAGSEDCLTLDVYAPPGAASAGRRLPVLLWIHGGGNTIGYGGNYDGTSFALDQDVVLVTINYRLGPLGWFRHASLRSPDTDSRDRSGNFGTLDQIQALHWVRENIAAFGGDPGNVTIFGESAGGRNVVMLLVSPLSSGLFHRAIVQSGSTRSLEPAAGERPADASPPGHRNSSSEILSRLLVTARRAPDPTAARAHLAGMSSEEVAGFLRGLSPQALIAAYGTEAQEGLLDLPQVFRDGAVLPAEEFPERLAAGRYHRVPVMLGTNRDEQKLFMAVDPRFVRMAFGLPMWRRDPDAYEARADHVSRAWKAAGADEPATAMSRHQPGQVFVYRFDWDEEARILWIDLPTLIGAGHGLEIPFVFGHFELGRRGNLLFDADNLPAREALSRKMQSYWAQFARTGDPGSGGDGTLTRWEPWGAEPPRFLVFDTEADGGVRHLTGAITRDDVVAEVLADTRLPDAAGRCAALAELVETRWIDADHYARAAGGACVEHPLAAR